MFSSKRNKQKKAKESSETHDGREPKVCHLATLEGSETCNWRQSDQHLLIDPVKNYVSNEVRNDEENYPDHRTDHF